MTGPFPNSFSSPDVSLTYRDVGPVDDALELYQHYRPAQLGHQVPCTGSIFLVLYE